MKYVQCIMLAMGLCAGVAWAQDGAVPAIPASAAGASRLSSTHSPRGSFGFISQLEKSVGLTPEQEDAVRGLLAEQRRQALALRGQTDQKIRALLNSEQQKKFDALLAEQKTRRSRGARPS